ncbi:MAG: GNAT family N-acetyltransferase [Clostridiaceae bacterium]|nr:GNAT family N-acetyltransferase [Clostridiaceae bacterium]
MTETIVYLPKEQWKGTAVPIRYTTATYYDVSVVQTVSGFAVAFEKKPFRKAITHTPEEYDFPDRLYADWWDGAEAYGIVRDGKLTAAIELWPEEWSNRLRVTELWVSEPLRGQGIGHALMNIAKEHAIRDRNRAVMLETQSCNVNAIGFYLHEGFALIGFDACAYQNNDIERREVRMEMGWFNPGASTRSNSPQRKEQA